MATPLMREALRPFYRAARNAHPGLLLQRGLDEHDEENKESKTQQIRKVCGVKPDSFYQHAFSRWRNATADEMRFRQIELALDSRLFIGLTGGGMLETGCAISHSYGMPYIPGSSIKGVVRAHVGGSPFGKDGRHAAVIAELFGAEADPKGSHPEGLSGLVSFHDAWWVPGSADTPLVEEIVTSHHLEYYGTEGGKPASDLDSPIPNAQIAVQGRFLFVLDGPPAWLDLAERMLVSALATQGIGAKTRTGYGLFDPTPKVPAQPTCAWVDEAIQQLVAAKRSNNADEALRGKGLAEKWKEIADPVTKAEALVDIRNRWNADDRGWWDSPPGKSAKQARAIYEDGATQ